MVALLRHQPVPNRSIDGRRRDHLRVVDGGGEGAGRPGYRLRPDPATGRLVGVSRERPVASGLPTAAIVAMAVLVLGGFATIRAVQGGPAPAEGRTVAPTTLDGGLAVAPAAATMVDEAAGDVLVLVGPGDSLWSIAEEVAPGRDPRPLVAALIEANGGVSLQIGQQIVIPGQLLD